MSAQPTQAGVDDARPPSDQSPVALTDPEEQALVLWDWLDRSPQRPHSTFAPYAIAAEAGLDALGVLDAFEVLVDRQIVRHLRWCLCSADECPHDPADQLPFLRSMRDVMAVLADPPDHWALVRHGPPPTTPAELDEQLATWDEIHTVRDLLCEYQPGPDGGRFLVGNRGLLRCTLLEEWPS